MNLKENKTNPFKKRNRSNRNNENNNKRKKEFESSEEEENVSIEQTLEKVSESKCKVDENMNDEDIEFKNKNAIDSNRLKESLKVDNSSVEENRSENSALSKYNELKKLSESRINEDGKKLYKGEKAYHQYINKNENEIRSSKYTGTMGPVNAPTNIRATTVIDYVQEICRDYKETGYCTFGDSCKFIHDRGDYKSGWELDKEWNEKEERRRKALLNGEKYDSDDEDKKYEIKDLDDDEDEDENGIINECGICHNELRNAVMTNCKHYFCRDCALKRYMKNKSCIICGKSTDGSFNVVKDIIELRKKQMKTD